MEFMNQAAKRKAPAGWIPFEYRIVRGGFLIAGQIPIGKKKDGKPKFGPKSRNIIVILTDSDLRAEEAVYSKETGNCSRCIGEGKLLKSWSRKHGVEYRSCDTCDGTGKAK